MSLGLSERTHTKPYRLGMGPIGLMGLIGLMRNPRSLRLEQPGDGVDGEGEDDCVEAEGEDAVDEGQGAEAL